MGSSMLYMSFLGTGNYFPCVYTWQSEPAEPTKFAQVAELSLLLKQGVSIDRVLIFGTSSSQSKHWSALKEELDALLSEVGTPSQFVGISEVLSTSQQWQDVQVILQYIPFHAEIILDLTHGFRSVPIVFSTALKFVQVVKQVSLKHVFYAMYDPGTKEGELVDYVGFYQIQEWTDAVGRLMESADARKISVLSTEQLDVNIASLQNSEELGKAMSDLTAVIRDVNVHLVEEKATHALSLLRDGIAQAEQAGDAVGRVLLEAVVAKFEALTQMPPSNGDYNISYVQRQLVLATLLLKHDLPMQTFTVLDECVGSLGMVYVKTRKVVNYLDGKGRSKRQLADAFKVMLRVERSEWDFKKKDLWKVNYMTPVYEFMERIEMEDTTVLMIIKDVIRRIGAKRHGFNHAWTSKRPEEYGNFISEGESIIQALEKVVETLKHHPS